MMTSRNIPVAESMTQLQQQFEEFRGTRTGRRKLPEALWQSAVEEARQHGVNVVAHALGLDYTALKRRLSGASTPERRTAPPAFVELMGATVARTDEYVIEFECVPNPRMRVQWKGAMPPDWTALLRAWREVSG